MAISIVPLTRHVAIKRDVISIAVAISSVPLTRNLAIKRDVMSTAVAAILATRETLRS